MSIKVGKHTSSAAMPTITRAATLGASLAAITLASASAHGQSSSLYVTEPAARAQRNQVAPAADTASPEDRNVAQGRDRARHELSPAIAATSLAAVRVPEPRQFAKHDLITIVIRESTETDFEATLETEKESSVDGEISAFPRLQLRELLNAQVRPNDMEQGNPAVGIDFSNEFEGNGEYSRSESITGRITARVLEVKPNGMLVLEARKHIKTDQEALDIVLTGTCRPEDVTIDNTVLSSQLYNLRLDKQHEGALNKSTQKGVLTKLLDFLFNF